jgi:hypothetical protein
MGPIAGAMRLTRILIGKANLPLSSRYANVCRHVRHSAGDGLP